MIIACFDIEASNLKADFGVPLGFVFKNFLVDSTNARPHFIGKRIVVDCTQSPQWKGNPADDRWVLRQFVKCWNETEFMVVGYNSLYYDVPFITSRLLRWNMKPLVPKFHLDLYRRVIKWNLATSRKSMQRISAFMQTHARKDMLMDETDLWPRAAGGDKRAIHRIVRQHCVRDVDTLEEIFYRTIPFVGSLRRW